MIGRFVAAWEDHGRAHVALEVEDKGSVTRYTGCLPVDLVVGLAPELARRLFLGAVCPVEEVERADAS